MQLRIGGENIKFFNRFLKKKNEINSLANKEIQNSSVNQDVINNLELNSYEYISGFSGFCSSKDCRDSLATALGYSLRQVEEIISSPQQYPMSAYKLGVWAYNTNGAIKSGINKMASMHYLSYILYSPKGKSSSKLFGKSKDKYNAVLKQIKYKKQIRDNIKRVCVCGTSYYYFEVSPRKATGVNKYMSDVDIQLVGEINSQTNTEYDVNIYSLPNEYCQMVSRHNGVPVIAFNLKYFKECYSENEIKRQLLSMPKEISRAYNIWDKTGNNSRNWVVLDWHKTIYVAINNTLRDKWGVPMALTSLDEILYANYFIDTKRGVLSNINNNLIYEVFPMRNDGSGKSTLTKEQQDLQHAAIKSAVTQKPNTQRASVLSLAAGTQLDKLTIDTSLFDEKNEKSIKDDVAESFGFSPSVLYGGSKSSGSNYATALLNLELVASDVYTIIEDYIEELDKCINYNVIKDDENCAKMYVLPITSFNRDKYFDKYKSIYADCGGAMMPLIASAGIEPDVYIDIMRYEREQNFDELFPPHQSMYTNSGKNDIGRPSIENLENENTITSKNNNANNSPSPSG